MAVDAALAEKFRLVWPHLNERQRRVLLGAEAKVRGRGGISQVAEAAGISWPTVQKSVRELEQPGPALPPDRARQAGGGRKPVELKDPGLIEALDALVDPDSRGDPESPLRWTVKSTRQLADALTAHGHPVSHRVVGELLHSMGYSLQSNRKTIEGAQHPDRNAQFEYIHDQIQRYLRAGQPVVSVDTKKKELVGQFKNAGQEWRPKGQAERVKVHDFEEAEQGKAIPYGVYDIGQDAGWVSVGQDHDTASFAVESLRRWWGQVGRPAYPKARRLLISADSGGSNGSRLRLWKWELARWARETDLEITVCHLPPGTSKWNRIEHRLFSHISMNWRGRPLTSHEVVVHLIGAARTRSGLHVQAEMDAGSYPKGTRISDTDFARLRIERHKFHGDWNYTIPSQQPP
jgi:transposase